MTTVAAEARQVVTEFDGGLLFTERRRCDLSQTDLAELAGLSHSEVSHLEVGRHKPTWRTLHLLAEALDIKAEHLIGISKRTTRVKGTPMTTSRKHTLREQITTYMTRPDVCGSGIVPLGVPELAERFSSTNATVQAVLQSMEAEDGRGVRRISATLYEFRVAEARKERKPTDSQVRNKVYAYMMAQAPNTNHHVQEVAAAVDAIPASTSGALNWMVRQDFIPVERAWKGTFRRLPGKVVDGLLLDEDAPDPGLTPEELTEIQQEHEARERERLAASPAEEADVERLRVSAWTPPGLDAAGMGHPSPSLLDELTGHGRPSPEMLANLARHRNGVARTAEEAADIEDRKELSRAEYAHRTAVEEALGERPTPRLDALVDDAAGDFWAAAEQAPAKGWRKLGTLDSGAILLESPEGDLYEAKLLRH